MSTGEVAYRFEWGYPAESCLAQEVMQLRAKLDAIDALHRPIGTGLCNECDFLYWPCPTHLILHPEDDA